MKAKTKTDMNVKYASCCPACLMNTSGTFRIPASTMNGNTRLLVRWNVAWILIFSGKRRFPDNGKDLPRGFDGAFGPPELLGLQRVDFRGEFRRRGDVVQVLELPSAQLGPVAEVEILGERVRLPVARVLDARLPPDARRAVEVDEEARPCSAPPARSQSARRAPWPACASGGSSRS